MSNQLAIVIPYYKISFFKKCLTSLQEQTCQQFHIYIGNDASPEPPEKLIDAFKKSLDISYNRFENNLGSLSLTQQWARCIRMVEKENWIMVLGDDDYLGPTVVEEFYKQLHGLSGKTNIIRFASQTVNAFNSNISQIYQHPKWEKSSDSQYKRMLGHTRSSLSEYVFSKDIYIKKNGFRNLPLGWHADDLAWLDFADHKPIYTINNSIVYIRNSDQNISNRKDNLDLKNRATLSYYNILINEKKGLYSDEQLGVILKRYEDLLRKMRIFTFRSWTCMFLNYLSKSNFRYFKNFLKRSIAKPLLKWL